MFGTILESNIYILIDTSSSMVNYIDFVKERLEILVKEQLEARKCKPMDFLRTLDLAHKYFKSFYLGGGG